MNPLRILFAILGFIFFVLGAIGVFLPIIPTTPFLLLAAFFFAKSSDRLNKWFLSTKLYQNHLDSFIKERAMTLKTKLCILIFASTMLIIAFIMMNNVYGRIFIAFLIVFKYYYFFFRIKTIKPGEKKSSPITLDNVVESVAEELEHPSIAIAEQSSQQPKNKKRLVNEKS